MTSLALLAAPASAAGITERVSLSNGGAEGNAFSETFGAISVNGRFAAFTSEASNLVAHDTNGVADVFVRDRKTGKNELASAGPGGAQSNGFNSGGEMSANGRFVAFSSEASNLVLDDTNGVSDVFVHSW